MRLTHPEYVKLVFRTYQLLRSTPEFSPALKQPTPASIRKECMTVYRERPEKKDEAVLRSFFGPAPENKSFLTAIENFPTDGFKAFSNYLKGKAVKTDDKNVELLAWLIDFPHRPFRFGMDVILNEKEKAILNSDESGGENQLEEMEGAEDDKGENILGQYIPNESKDNILPTAGERVPVVPINPLSEMPSEKMTSMVNKKWGIVGLTIFLMILSVGVYLLYDKDDNCMYWADDHYEQVPCNEAPKGRLVVALDEEKLKNFKKITRADTITAWSIGKIYYLKNNGALEYYTAGGNHPVFVTRTLRVLSPYMFNKYLLAHANKKP